MLYECFTEKTELIKLSNKFPRGIPSARIIIYKRQ